jgi:adenine-specific DNA-methyltransferase
MLDYLKRLIITLKKTTTFGKIYTQLIENLNKCPDMQNLLDHLKILLQKDERLLSQGEILKNKVIELALKLDKDLIKLLLSDEKMKEVFFVDVDGTLIFDKDKFVRFVSNKQFLPDSYTAFKNKIGLIDEKGEFISEKKEVVLSWPYKDCVLEGGMTKEDQKRDEIFWNEILAPDEISRLLNPKVFTNAKRIDAKGEHKLDKFKTDEKGDIKDNLIIKGNNLLALHSLRKRFAGKVKLIYIDPPYYFKSSPSSDTFLYNTSFKLSSWLTFMKDRLKVAQELLSKDGVIFIQINEDGLGYLKILLDEILGENNFINEICVKVKNVAGVAAGGEEISLRDLKESILVYAKDKKSFSGFKNREYWEEMSVEDIEDLKVIYKIGKVYKTKEIISGSDLKIKMNYHKDFQIMNLKQVAEKEKIDILVALEKYKDYVFNDTFKSQTSIRELVIKNSTEHDLLISVEYTPRSGSWSGQNIRQFYIGKIKRLVGLIGHKVKIEKGTVFYRKTFGNIWTDISWNGITNEGGVVLNFGKKPEKLLYRIIDITTEPGDIVLDFFAGTGTTCAVAHKMGRQYIGVEQLDYGENSAVVRLKNVINGDQTGISKEVGWQGGGDFVYLELMKWNENFVEKILSAKTKDELKKLWATMKEKAFLSYKVDVKTIDEHAKDFDDLSIEDQKRFLLECLDKNHLYVNYSEIDDEEYGVSEEDKKLNRGFYEG